MRIETVQTGFHTADLFDSVAENVMARVDVDSSVHRYADLLHDELTETFPGAEITINWDDDEGALSYHLQAQINGDQGHGDVQYIMACEEDAFNKDWVCYLSDEECATLGDEELAAQRRMDEAEERWYALARENEEAAKWERFEAIKESMERNEHFPWEAFQEGDECTA